MACMLWQRRHGLHAVAAALRYEPRQLRGLWVERQRRDARIQTLLDEAASRGVPIRQADRSELDRLSGGVRHQGILAQLVAQQRAYDEADLPALRGRFAGVAGGGDRAGTAAGVRWSARPAQSGCLSA